MPGCGRSSRYRVIAATPASTEEPDPRRPASSMILDGEGLRSMSMMVNLRAPLRTGQVSNITNSRSIPLDANTQNPGGLRREIDTQGVNLTVITSPSATT